MTVTAIQETWMRERQASGLTDMHATVFGFHRQADDRDPIRADKNATVFRMASLPAFPVQRDAQRFTGEDFQF